MAGLPADDRLWPPDPSTMEGNLNPSAAQELTDDSMSTSPQLREGVIHTAVVEAELEESRRNIERGQKITGKDRDNSRLDVQATSDTGGSESLQDIEATNPPQNIEQRPSTLEVVRTGYGYGESFPVTKRN